MSIYSKVVIALSIFSLQACNESAKQEKADDITVVTNAVIANNHFNKKGKTPSSFTIVKQQQLRKSLPFKDTRDFEEAKKGFISKPLSDKIMANAGHVA